MYKNAKYWRPSFVKQQKQHFILIIVPESIILSKKLGQLLPEIDNQSTQ